ncbi:MAG: CinA family nicotinamide mononucleotide deamidase-related protein [Proteobacteria bacterium]|nr:CinA family nicotinamide mononucleotide deamidase-related protein [Pseudomonadota bacterium]
MNIEIISTGEELLYGSIEDENGAYIARSLVENGFDIGRHSCVGDDLPHLTNMFKEADGRAQVVIVTGGLGPTLDDRTRSAVAGAFGKRLCFSKLAEKSVNDFFKKRGKDVPESNKSQMTLPDGAVCLENTVGTAPGFSFHTGNSLFYFLPGVPSEMRHMMASHVIPGLVSLNRERRDFFFLRAVSHFGISEAEVDMRLSGLENAFPGIKLGLRAVFPVIHVKLYARGGDTSGLNEQLQSAQDWVLDRTGDYAFSTEDRSLAEEVGLSLIRHKKTLALAESCTGGLISHMLTQVAGSSEYFLFSGVTYSNQSKVRILGVPEELLHDFGAVSEQTVSSMAERARIISGADFGLATSGIAGPGGGSTDKPVGTVFIGLSSQKGTRTIGFKQDYGEREKNKTAFAMTALDFLRRELG